MNIKKLLGVLIASIVLFTAVFSSVTTAYASPDDYSDYPFMYQKVDDHIVPMLMNPNFEGDLVIPQKIDGLPVGALMNGFGGDIFNLTSLTIPDGIELPDGIFYNCTNLKSIQLPTNLTVIDSYSFCECVNLKEVNIPANVTYIGTGAFSHCSSLFSVTFPNKVTTIGSEAFANCNNLKSITIPKSCTQIGIDAFKECYLLKDIYFEGTQYQWDNMQILDQHDSIDESLTIEDIIIFKNANVHVKNPTEPVVPTFSINGNVLAKMENKTLEGLFTKEEYKHSNEIKVMLSAIPHADFSTDKKEVVENFIKKQDNGYEANLILDIDLTKYVDKTIIELEDLGGEYVDITLNIPQKAQGENKEFVILKVDDDRAYIYDKDFDQDDSTFTFKTNEFSTTYALAQVVEKEVVKEPTKESNSEISSDTTSLAQVESSISSKATEYIILSAILLVAIVIVFVLILIIIKK